LEELRSQGAETRLLKSQVERLKKHGRSKIQLWVNESNMPARRLYKSLDFEEANKVQDYYAPGRPGIAVRLAPFFEVFMECRLALYRVLLAALLISPPLFNRVLPIVVAYEVGICILERRKKCVAAP